MRQFLNEAYVCCLWLNIWSFEYNLDANKHNEVHCLTKKLRIFKLIEGNNSSMHSTECNYTQGLYLNDVHPKP